MKFVTISGLLLIIILRGVLILTLAPDNTVLILEDIPPKYISNIKNYDEFIKDNSL